MTTDTVTFKAHSDPLEREFMFVFSTEPAFTWDHSFPWAAEDDRDRARVDLGLLAGKLGHLGRYWWALCPLDRPLGEPGSTVLLDQCSPSWTFTLRFRLPDLTKARARAAARYVISRRFGSYWRAGYDRKASCVRATRTRRRCRVSVVVGDVVVWGRVTVYSSESRPGTPSTTARASTSSTSTATPWTNGR